MTIKYKKLQVELNKIQRGVLDSMGGGRNAYQIATGEGKTFIIASSAVKNALQGDRVLIITASEYLANRDYKINKSFFEDNDIKSGSIADLYGNIESINDYDILYTDIFSWVTMLSESKFSASLMIKPFDYLIVDEADLVVFDYGSMYLTNTNSVFVDLSVHSAVIDRFSSMRLDEGITNRGIIEIADDIHRNRPEFDKARLKMMIYFIVNDLLEAKQYQRGVDYTVDGDRVLWYDKFTGNLSTNTTVSTGVSIMIHLLNGLNMDTISNPTSINTVYGIIKGYKRFSLLSGTLEFNRAEIEDVFNLNYHNIEKNNKKTRKIHPNIYTNDYDGAAESIESIIRKNSGSFVVIADSDSAAQSIYSNINLDSSLNKRVSLFSGSDQDNEGFLEFMSSAGAVAITSGHVGRGINIVTDENLSIIIVGCSEERRQDVQKEGRCARYNTGGDVYYIITKEDKFFRGVNKRNLDILFGSSSGVLRDKNIRSLIDNRQRKNTSRAYINRVKRYENTKEIRLHDKFFEDIKGEIITNPEKIIKSCMFHHIERTIGELDGFSYDLIVNAVVSDFAISYGISINKNGFPEINLLHKLFRSKYIKLVVNFIYPQIIKKYGDIKSDEILSLLKHLWPRHMSNIIDIINKRHLYLFNSRNANLEIRRAGIESKKELMSDIISLYYYSKMD